MVMAAGGGGGGGQRYINPLQDIIGSGTFGQSPYPSGLSRIGSSATGSVSRVNSAPSSSLSAPSLYGPSSYSWNQREGQITHPYAAISSGKGAGWSPPPVPKPASPGAQSAEDMLQRLLGGAPTYQAPPSVDYMEQAGKIYDPQLQYLAGLEGQSKKNAAQSGKSLDEMYAELASSIGAEAGDINQDYGTALKDTAAAAKAASDATNKSFDNSRNGAADTLARLGIQEAAPNVVGQNTEMQQLMQGIASANDQATKNQLTQERASALDYNTATKDTAKLAGGEAKVGLQKQLQGFLQEIGLKKADVKSMMTQWAAEQQGKDEQTAYQRYRDSMSDWQWKTGFGADQSYKAAQLAQDQAAAAAKASSSSQSDAPKLKDMDPIGALNAIALDSYGGNRTAATNGVKAITDTASKEFGSNPPRSMQEFVNAVIRRNDEANGDAPLTDLGNLTRLANEYWERVYSRAQ